MTNTGTLTLASIAQQLDTAPPTIELISLADLSVDPQVQRALSGPRVEQLAKEFNPLGLGILTVNQRADGSTHVVDGQHRKAAANRVGFDDKVLCHVFRGLTKEQEAALFLLLNNTRRTGPQDTWRMRVEAGDPNALGQKALLLANGWRVSTTSNGRGAFTAVAALDKVWRRSKDLADKTIRTLTLAYGNNPAGVQKVLILAVASVYDRYEGMENPNRSRGAAFLHVDKSRMVQRLSGYDGGAAGLLTAARQQSKVLSLKVVDAAAVLIVNTYNHALQGNRLPAWESNNAKNGPGENVTSLTSLVSAE